MVVAFGMRNAQCEAVADRDVIHLPAVARKIRAGQVDVNGGRFNPMAPFGGYKRSGLGRENGMDMIKEYLQTKSVWIDMGNEVPNPFVLR